MKRMNENRLLVLVYTSSNCTQSIDQINPFVPNASFLYPLKKSENLMVSWYFQRVENEWIGSKCVNTCITSCVKEGFAQTYLGLKSYFILPQTILPQSMWGSFDVTDFATIALIFYIIGYLNTVA